MCGPVPDSGVRTVHEQDLGDVAWQVQALMDSENARAQDRLPGVWLVQSCDVANNHLALFPSKVAALEHCTDGNAVRFQAWGDLA